MFALRHCLRGAAPLSVRANAAVGAGVAARSAVNCNCANSLHSRCARNKPCFFHNTRQFSTKNDANASFVAPDPATGQPPISPELRALADKIASLSMIDQFLLTRAIAERVGLPYDALLAMATASGGGGGGGGGIGAGAARPAAGGDAGAGEKKEEAKEAVKRTAATVRLLEVAADAKYKVLKEVRKLVPAMPLIDCKNLIEKLPADVKADVPIAEAEAAKAAIEAAGGKVELA